MVFFIKLADQDIIIEDKSGIPTNLNSQKDLDSLLERLNDIKVDDINEEKRKFVKKMMSECWEAYVKYGFGENEVNVVKKEPYPNYILGSKVGITIVDSIDTLLLMGMFEEYKTARSFVKESLEFGDGTNVNLFEWNIRVLGGLLSSYYLTNDEMFLTKAKKLGDTFLRAFIGVIPVPNFYVGSPSTIPQETNLAEVGTLHLEFEALSDLTSISDYKKKVSLIREMFKEEFQKNGKPTSCRISVSSGSQMGDCYSMGSESDSYFEYLIKSYVYDTTNNEKELDFFLKSIGRIEEKTLRTSRSNRLYFGKYTNGGLSREMEHLACFTGGMYALASVYITNPNVSMSFMRKAKKLTDTCYKSCFETETKLCPDNFIPEKPSITSTNLAFSPNLLRPEIIESLFYLFRITGDEKYRDQAFHRHSRVSSGGYSSILNVNQVPVSHKGVQESFFMAETLKYAYLIFSDKNFVSLNEWVFNTEAHPFRIKKK